MCPDCRMIYCSCPEWHIEKQNFLRRVENGDFDEEVERQEELEDFRVALENGDLDGRLNGG